MTSPPTTNQDSSTEEHNHYWPLGLIPVTPQARRFGYPMNVYVTTYVWKHYCIWSGGQNTNTDKRLFELLDSCFVGIGKGLATSPDMVSFSFKHWLLRKNKPKSKKTKVQLGGRLLLHPETEEPWLLIFDPAHDDKSQLKKGEAPDGEPETDRENETVSGKPGNENRTTMDPTD